MSLPLYNPGLVGADDSINTFAARADLLRVAIEELNARQPQHHLFIGQRGMGKTTLLRRIAAEVDRDPALSARWIALRFPEEQYNIARLSDLWLNCLDALADALERTGGGAAVEELDRFIHALPREEGRRAALALEHLLGWTVTHRGLVLCVDNLQQVLGRLDKDGRWALRRVLGGDHRLVVFAASPALPSAASEYGEAFYDFFQAHWLRGLDLAETTAVLRKLAERAGAAEVIDAIARNSGRLRALHVLTGGNPRTVAHLFHVIAQSPGADVRQQLEALLDQCTPLYKARFEELADQAQIVLDALALAWDPTTAAAIAAHTRMEVNTVSTQLHRLHGDGLVDKVDIPGVARQGFQVSERFFNLWYLMRASRRLRGRVLSLARCLETLYEAADLQKLGATMLCEPGEADLTFAVARTLPDGAMRRALWGAAIDRAPGDFGLGELLAQLAPGEEPVRDLAERKHRVKEALAVANGVDFEGMGIERELGEVACAWMTAETGSVVDVQQWRDGFRALASGIGTFRPLFGRAAWGALKGAVLNGELPTLAINTADRRDLEAAGLRHGCPHLAVYADLLNRTLTSPPLDTDAVVATGDVRLVALASRRAGNLAQALQLALRATELAPDLSLGWELAVYWASCSRPPDPIAASYAVHAVALGSTDPLSLAWSLVSARGGEPALVTRQLEESEHVAAGLAAMIAANVLAPTSPDLALRLWRRRAKDGEYELDAVAKLLGELVAANHIDTAMTVAEEARERALPLYAAMVAVRGGDASLLGQFAPEVAVPARDVLETIWPAGVVAASAKKRQRRKH